MSSSKGGSLARLALRPPPRLSTPSSTRRARCIREEAASNPTIEIPYNPPVSNLPTQARTKRSSGPEELPVAVDVVIPAYNEECSLSLVLEAIPRPPVRRVVVADNNSADRTAEVARQGGAEVVPAPVQGYGSACLAALDHLRRTGAPEIVVFLDADFSDHPEELPQVVEPILHGDADVVIGSRVLGEREKGALLPQARAGNLVACTLIRLLYGHRYTDLGPFRAARWPELESLGMEDPNFGWTAELQVKALRKGLRVVEVPVSYRKRVGVSKITGTLQGTIRAGYKILWTVFRYSFARL
ncbi:MAG: glycosyltransferase family 2 protein [Acidobacteria bacterium]|nr:glycosyltransferase family 2 protein [Acidobacteriota bacterium]